MTPEGWDDNIPEGLLDGMRELRRVYVAMLTTGFTATEAAQIIGNIISASMAGQAGGSE